MNVLHSRRTLYSTQELKDRGWTATAIGNFLPEPDDERDNPHYKSAAPMKFWLRRRVHRSEKTKRFLQWKEGLAKRRASSQKAVRTRISNMEQRMRDAELTIDATKTTREIYEIARRTYNGNYRGDRGSFYWSHRQAINTIRHRLTNYEQLWDICNRGDTGEDAYFVLRERVDDLISKTYPQFDEDDVDPPPLD